MLSLEECRKREIIRIVAGSHLHGLNVEGSDRDEEGIIIEPFESAWGFKGAFEETISETADLDVKYVSLKKWCRLALGGNPNFLLTLFAPENMILRSNAVGGRLREMRTSFLSKHSVTTHLGYLNQQRKRLLKGESNDGRGQPRVDLIVKYGYDTKFAMHMIRLGHQGLELVTGGHIQLPIGIREELLAIREGKMTLPEVMEWAHDLEKMIEHALPTCKLPDEPDSAKVEAFMRNAYMGMWSSDRQAADRKVEAEMFSLPNGISGDQRCAECLHPQRELIKR